MRKHRESVTDYATAVSESVTGNQYSRRKVPERSTFELLLRGRSMKLSRMRETKDERDSLEQKRRDLIYDQDNEKPAIPSRWKI